jgi:hypothetical protein
MLEGYDVCKRRTDIAALDATTGNATHWNPDANSAVNVLVASGTFWFQAVAFLFDKYTATFRSDSIFIS